MNDLQSTVKECPRCGHQHPDLVFKAFTEPVHSGEMHEQQTFTHWTLCPANGEPILVQYIEIKEIELT